MDPTTAQALIELNRRFYSEFGPAFAATRRRIQEGVRRALGMMPDEGAWLDAGCGSGALAVEWLRRGRKSAYVGVDFSAELLAEAEASARREHGYAQGSVAFLQADLAQPGWAGGARAAGWQRFSGAVSFAVLHHLPSHAIRARVLGEIREMVPPGGLFIHSVWQFHHSPKLLERVLPWSAAGFDHGALEPGDTLLDWRYALPSQAEQRGLRYVHRFEPGDLEALAREAGFRVIETYESDGAGGRLGLYQAWSAV